MDLKLGERYEALRSEVRSFLAAHRDEAPKRGVGGAGVSREWQRLLVDRGWVGRSIPQAYGGFGAEADPLEDLVIEEEFAAAGIALGQSNQGIDMLIPTVLHYGDEVQKERYIGPTLRGEVLWCQGYSEPGSGSDLASLRTSGRLEGEVYFVNGQKIWTSTAQEADMMFALVRTEAEARKHAGITYLVFAMDSPGVEVRPLKTMAGDAMFNEVFFTDLEVPRENVIGEPGQGWEIGTYLLRFERHMLGNPENSRRFFDSCVELMRHSGALRDPLYRDRLMGLQARLLAMKYHRLRLLSELRQGKDSGVGGLIVKLNGCQLNYDICALALDVLGEAGLLEDEASAGWQRSHMLALGLIIGGGTAQIQKNLIAELGLGMPRGRKGGQ